MVSRGVGSEITTAVVCGLLITSVVYLVLFDGTVSFEPVLANDLLVSVLASFCFVVFAAINALVAH